MMLHPIVEQVLMNFSAALIVTVSLNIEVGLLRIPQFGRLLAVVMGAVVVGAVPGRLLALVMGLPAGAEYADSQVNPDVVTTINAWLAQNPPTSLAILALTLALAAAVGGFVGYLSAYPALRLKGAYLGITLLTFGEVAVSVANNYQPLVGGTAGVWTINPLGFLGPKGRALMVFLTIAIALSVYAYAELLTRSPFGRALKAIRDSELAAKVYGRDEARARAATLTVGGAVAALAGALWALYTGSVRIGAYTRLEWTFWPWAFMMLGGVGNNLGVLVGTLLFTAARTVITIYKFQLAAIIPVSPEWLEYLLVGLVLVTVVLYRPQGLLPERPALALPRRRVEEIRRRAMEVRDQEAYAKV